jgi:predicted small lipoprotein YifL
MRTRQIPRLLLLICMLLAGCGQTGPLYLPEPEQEPEQEQPQAPPPDPGETAADPAASN